MRRAGFPRNALDVVGTVGHGNDHRVAVERGSLPQVIGGRGHDLAVALEGHGRRGSHAAIIKNDAPVTRLTVLRLEVKGVFEADDKGRVGDGVGAIVAVCTRGETRNGERDRGKEAQGHQDAHRPTAAREPPRGEGSPSPSVLHNGSP